MNRREEVLSILNKKHHEELTLRDVFKSRNSMLLTQQAFNLVSLYYPEMKFHECVLSSRLTISQTLKLKKLNTDIYFLDKDYKTIYTTCNQFMGIFKLSQGENETIFLMA